MHIQHTRNTGFSLPALLLGLISLVAGAWLAQTLLNREPPAPSLSASTTRLEPARVIKDFDLLDHRQQPFTLAQLQGRWTFMFFGYTHCPDICPTTLTTLNDVARKIAALPDTAVPQYAFVTIDPERDTTELLAKYVPYFNPDFLGVTGTPAAIDALTKQLSVLYLKMEPQKANDTGYLMDHSAAILLLDPQGRLHALMSPPFDTAQMAADYSKLTQYYEATQ